MNTYNIFMEKDKINQHEIDTSHYKIAISRAMNVLQYSVM